MSRAGKAVRLCALLLTAFCVGAGAFGQSSRQARAARQQAAREEAEFGPVVRAYLGYLNAQQEVVDDRASRHEIDRRYYRRNSNRIRALRQTAIRIARETENDYLPELEAVARDEFNLLFDEPPPTESLRAGETLDYTFRYLGEVRSGGELFYVFARLDPYEQAELRKKADAQPATAGGAGSPATPQPAGPAASTHAMTPHAAPASNPPHTFSVEEGKRPRRVSQP